MGDLPINITNNNSAQQNFSRTKPGSFTPGNPSSFPTQPPIIPPIVPPRGSIAVPSTSSQNSQTSLFLQQQQQPLVTSQPPRMSPLQPNIVGHALYSHAKNRSSSTSGYGNPPSGNGNPMTSQVVGTDITSHNLPPSGYKHQQHLLLQHQQRLHQQHHQKNQQQKSTQQSQQHISSQQQYHPPAHQQPRLNQVQSFSSGEPVVPDDPHQQQQHNPAAAAYFPSNQRHQSIDGYVHSNHALHSRHPRTSSGISNSSVPTRPPPRPESRGVVPSRPYPGMSQLNNPQQFEQQVRYDTRGSIAATREDLEMAYMKEHWQSLVNENLQLKSDLESTNGNKESQIVQLQNQLQEERKMYNDIYKRYQFDQQKLLTLENEAKSLMQTIDAQNMDSVQFQTEKSSLEGENDKLQKLIQDLNQQLEQKEKQKQILEGDNKQLLLENTELRKQITRMEKQLEKDASASQVSFSPAPSNNGASDGSDSLKNRRKLAKRFKVNSLADLRTFDDSSSVLSSVPGSHEKHTAANISYSNQTSSQALHPFNQSASSNWSTSPQSPPDKRQRSSIAHPPRLKMLESELNPIIQLETQKSMSAEELNTLDRRAKQMTANQNEARMRFRKNKSKSQSLSKMSTQNKIYSHLQSRPVPHSTSNSSIGAYYEELSLEAQEIRSDLQKLYDLPMSKWGGDHVVTFFQHKLHMPEKVVVKAKENIKSGERLLDLMDSDMKKYKEYLGITDELQRIRVITNMKVMHDDEFEVPQEVRLFPQLLKMDYVWVSEFFLPHLGLQNLCEKFKDQFIDLLVLITLTEKEIAAICSKIYQLPKMAAKSISFGLRLLKRFNYDYKDLKRRIKNVEKIDEDLIVWSNQRLIDWVKNIENDDSIANNLKNTGINGSFLVFSKFSALEFAKVLDLKFKNESHPNFTHLKEKYDDLVNEQREKIKQEKENERSSRRHKQAQTYTHDEGIRYLQENQNSNSIRRSLSNSLTRASRFIRKSGSRGSSRASSRDASQDRRSVASTIGAMTRESIASSNAVGSYYAAGHSQSFQSYR